MKLENPSVGLLVPLFRSQDHIVPLIAFVNELCTRISNPIVLTLVVDGCTESERVVRLNLEDFRCPVRLIVLSRNFGVNGALRAGMSFQDESIVVAFGSDLQEPLELFIDFASEMTSGNFDFIFGQRVQRDDPLFTRATSKFYWWFNRTFVLRDSPKGGFDVFACNSVARNALISMTESRTNITSQMLWLGFRRKFVGFERKARVSGKSTWTLRKKVALFVDSVFAFSNVPFGMIKFLNGLSTLFVVVSVSGNLSEKLQAAAFMFWLMSFHLAIVALSRIHELTKQRPQFVIQSIEIH